MQLGWSALLKDTNHAPGEDQTHNLVIKSLSLSQLSYRMGKIALIRQYSFEFNMYRYGSKYADTMANSEGPY